MGAILHPATTLLNAGWIEETQGDFKFYVEGLTSSVAQVLEILDCERMSVASSLGIQAQTVLDWLKMSYCSTGENLREAILKQTSYYQVKAPSSLNHRYIFEEVPMGLVPIASLGENNGVPVKGITSIIQLACMIHRKDYWSTGRSLKKLGLSGYTVKDLAQFVNTGEAP